MEEYEKYDRERRICVYFLASADIREKEEEVTQRKEMSCRSTGVVSTVRLYPIS